jgi:para-aminobenzoate synthetase component 1
MKNIIAEVNRLAAAATPFLLIVDFDLQQPLLHEITSLPAGLMFATPRFCHPSRSAPVKRAFTFHKQPPTRAQYARAFANVMAEIRHGNSFLVNLTFPTPIETDLSPAEIYHLSTAKYKCHVPDTFVCFSPEIFVQIEGDRIYSYPMKGTIDATLPNAAERILADPKEEAEHNTIVDLIRNDLSMVADEVRVDRFRYLDRLETHRKPLLQVSSQISGRLPADYRSRLGNILFSLLPAGSVSGAPKPDTIRIIRESEIDARGYYTGIMAYYDGESLDSGVLIRFIEKRGDEYLYRSGGGITFQSDLDAEYQELIDKVYLPFT